MNETPSPALVDGLRDLLAKATSGPWEQSGLLNICGQTGELVARLSATVGKTEYELDNLRLIVAAVNALPALLDTLARLAGENERLKESDATWNRIAGEQEAELARVREALAGLVVLYGTPEVSDEPPSEHDLGYEQACAEFVPKLQALAANPQGATDERA